ncbi:hypothetical protein HNR77_001441 [Paenibacillus sp. JGP012]|uniref:hypothetical protein n=1 Tax=Paenibacillus sp. JGP012 TaxID=2735914 RepID=UPI00161DD85B|nr:hypothetical protein [Paenibacillus sp. JGP012]MBB6020380.1 hypothetical protein [Paenibacillus sp. JGP012]
MIYIFIGFLIIIIPVIPLLSIAKKGNELIEMEEMQSFELVLSWSTPIKKNHTMIYNYLVKNLDVPKERASVISDAFKALQMRAFLYILAGLIQISSIALYIVFFLSNLDFSNILLKDPNVLGIQFTMLVVSLISFWIFYGEKLFEYLGFDRVKENISNAIQISLRSMDRLINKLTTPLLYLLYFVFMVLYLGYTIPFVHKVVDGSFKLIAVCVLLFLFYYMVPWLFGYLRSIVLKKIGYYRTGKDNFLPSLRNTTYLFLLIFFVYATLFGSNNGLLIQAITILFLFDTYLQNRKKINEQI